MSNKSPTESELNTKGYVRGYHRLSKAWYSSMETVRIFNVDILFGMYRKEGGCFAEMKIEWVPLQNQLSPRVCAFEDSWLLFGLFSDLFEKLGDYQGKNVGEEEFSTILDWFGFKDFTQYENPSDSENSRGKIELNNVTKCH